jgi:hypothetical protein
MYVHSRMPEKPGVSGKSTLLIATSLYSGNLLPGLLKGKSLREYFHFLLNDPDLEYKLSFLAPKKWKKHYQDEGQDLRAVRFFPFEEDWARISVFSNATGFSRCFIFIYLMKIDLGLIQLPKKRTTVPEILLLQTDRRIHCSVLLDEQTKILERRLGIPRRQ